METCKTPGCGRQFDPNDTARRGIAPGACSLACANRAIVLREETDADGAKDIT